jgi:NAD(P)-dependent dehydrogenase (short-subunit alcohol dehydrogenase family)
MKIILITGASRGIGYETAKQLAEAGNIVVATCRNPIDLQTKKLSEMSNVHIQKLDVTNETDAQHVYNFVDMNFGYLDVLINNAGIGETEQSGIRKTISKLKTNSLVGKIYPFLKPIIKNISAKNYSTKQINAPNNRSRIIAETNFYGPWLMCSIFHNLLIKGSESQIINVSSGMGLLQNLSGYLPAYSLSKATLNALTIMLANVYKGS